MGLGWSGGGAGVEDPGAGVHMCGAALVHRQEPSGFGGCCGTDLQNQSQARSWVAWGVGTRNWAGTGGFEQVGPLGASWCFRTFSPTSLEDMAEQSGQRWLSLSNCCSCPRELSRVGHREGSPEVVLVRTGKDEHLLSGVEGGRHRWLERSLRSLGLGEARAALCVLVPLKEPREGQSQSQQWAPRCAVSYWTSLAACGPARASEKLRGLPKDTQPGGVKGKGLNPACEHPKLGDHPQCPGLPKGPSRVLSPLWPERLSGPA